LMLLSMPLITRVPSAIPILRVPTTWW